jgi:hypothetical protein
MSNKEGRPIEEILSSVHDAAAQTPLPHLTRLVTKEVSLELCWQRVMFVPSVHCVLSIVDREQADGLRKSSSSNSFFARLDKEGLLRLRNHADALLEAWNDTEAQFGTPEELQAVQDYERELAGRVWREV